MLVSSACWTKHVLRRWVPLKQSLVKVFILFLLPVGQSIFWEYSFNSFRAQKKGRKNRLGMIKCSIFTRNTMSQLSPYHLMLSAGNYTLDWQVTWCGTWNSQRVKGLGIFSDCIKNCTWIQIIMKEISLLACGWKHWTIQNNQSRLYWDKDISLTNSWQILYTSTWVHNIVHINIKHDWKCTTQNMTQLSANVIQV